MGSGGVGIRRPPHTCRASVAESTSSARQVDPPAAHENKLTSCAAATLTRPCLLVLSATLAAEANGGRCGLLIPLVLGLLLTTSYSMSRRFTRRTARTIAGAVSPSAALVLY